MTSEEKRDNPEIVEQAKKHNVKQWWLRSLGDVERMIQMAKAEAEESAVIPKEVLAEVAEQSAPVEDTQETTDEELLAAVSLPDPVKEVEPAPVERRVAPKMPLVRMGEDSRTKLLATLDAENPGIKHLFQNASSTDEELRNKGMERTGQMLKNDIVVRTDAERFALNKTEATNYHRKMMGAIDTEGDKILSLTEDPKKGRT